MVRAALRTLERQPVILLITLLLASALSACQPGMQPAPLPTPATLVVQHTPALQPLGTLFRDCVLELPNTGLVLLETPASAMNLDQTSLALRWGAGSAAISYAAVVGEEELVVIAHLSSPLDQISVEDLRAIYQGRLREWQAPLAAGAIEAWAYPAGEDAQEVFEGAVMDGIALDSRTAWLAPDPRAMREAVAGSPAALGFLPRTWLDDSVKALAVQGLAPERLRQPVLALSKSEPIGPEKAWLICLQQAPR